MRVEVTWTLQSCVQFASSRRVVVVSGGVDVDGVEDEDNRPFRLDNRRRRWDGDRTCARRVAYDRVASSYGRKKRYYAGLGSWG